MKWGLPMKMNYVESVGRSDVFKTDLRVERSTVNTPAGPQEVVQTGGAMATMGRRKLTGTKVLKPADNPLVSIEYIDMNLIISPIQIQSVAVQGFEAPVLGVPIMREGFVTETGFLVGSAELPYNTLGNR